jgi:predicted glycosyltransferase
VDVRVWVDITAASQAVFFAPIVRRLEDAGHVVTLTARRFASADLVLRRYGLGAVLTARHRGGGLGARAVGLVNRTAQLLGSASSGRFDVAVGSHGSDLILTAWTLGIPQLTFFDDERRTGNLLNVRLVDEVAVPEAMPATTLAQLGAPSSKLFRYPGFREEYYLADVRPDPEALGRLGVDVRRIVGVVRPAPPGRPASDGPDAAESVVAALVRELAARHNVTLVLVARDPAQQRRFAALGVRGLVVPEGPVDGIGLIAGADFLLGAGGAMPREAVALGTPAYTIAQGPPSAVDAMLLSQGRLRRVRSADDVALAHKERRLHEVLDVRRDPAVFVAEIERLAGGAGRAARLGRLVRDDER